MNLPRLAHPRPSGRRAFTLLEMLLALAITAGLLAALFASLSVVFGMRQRATAQLQGRLTLRVALDHMVQDLLLAVRAEPPSDLAGEWLGEPGHGLTGQRADRLEFITARGGLATDGPMVEHRGDRVRVAYQLVADPQESDPRFGGLLVRQVTENLLAPIEPEPVAQILARGVLGLEVLYEDQDDWTDTWDPVARGSARPRAVRVRLIVRADDTPEEERRAAGRSVAEREISTLAMERLVLLPTQLDRLGVTAEVVAPEGQGTP